MAFDGIVACAMAKELRDALLLGKVEKVYQPEPEELVLHIHTNKGNYKLYASAGSSHARMHFISETPANPPSPLGFCMLLRKHLQGGRIVAIEQKGAERIIEIHFETLNELGFSLNKKLIFEIMGKHSNIILVNAETEAIIDSIKRISIDINRMRQILPGKQYLYPPAQNKISFKTIEKEQMIPFAHDPKKLLDGIQGISPAIAQMLSDQPDPYNTLLQIRSSLDTGEISPAVYLKEDGTPGDFHAVPLNSYETKQTFDTLSEAVDYYFVHKQSSNRVRQKSSDLEKALKNHLDKLYLKKQRLGEDLLKAENSDKYRLYGELLTANLHLIKTGDPDVVLTNYYDGSEIKIPLDQRYSPAKNAQRYFKKYGKSKTALKEKKIQMDETDQDIAYLESVSSYIERAETVEEVDTLRAELADSGFLKKRKTVTHVKKAKPKPLQYTTSDGFRVLVGKNNKENDHLTFKTAKNKDVWFHTKDIPGSHVIVFTEGRTLSETAIFEAAAIAAYHSKGRPSENVPVDYTLVSHVKKPAGAKPGMVIFTHNKTVYVTPQVPKPTVSSSQ